jgi:hypothetical protein
MIARMGKPFNLRFHGLGDFRIAMAQPGPHVTVGQIEVPIAIDIFERDPLPGRKGYRRQL